MGTFNDPSIAGQSENSEDHEDMSVHVEQGLHEVS